MRCIGKLTDSFENQENKQNRRLWRGWGETKVFFFAPRKKKLISWWSFALFAFCSTFWTNYTFCLDIGENGFLGLINWCAIISQIFYSCVFFQWAHKQILKQKTNRKLWQLKLQWIYLPIIIWKQIKTTKDFTKRKKRIQESKRSSPTNGTRIRFRKLYSNLFLL